MLEGRYFGTMCLSEPDAGSSLADITTKAVPAADGTYRVTGTKMWITGGDHELTDNIVHLVLAKAPGGGPGVKGISLFIVPKFLPDGTRNDVALVSLNHKMGNHGTTNALLNFGDGTHQPAAEPGAVGYLVGEEHKGLTYMFHMMNEARMAVGMQAMATGYAGYLASLAYAKERTQGRPVDAKDPARPPVALIEHADVKRMLLAQKSYVEGAFALGLYCAMLVDEERTSTGADRDRAHLLLEVLTPIAKSWPAQWCLEANSLAIQVHGGYGYTKEFDVEQCYRDNRLNAIHEGTHGIHGLDLLGRKVVMQDGAGLTLLAERINQTIDKALESDTHRGLREGPAPSGATARRRHRDPLGRRRYRHHPRQLDDLPRGGRARRGGVDVARAADRRQRPPGRLLRRQTRCGTVLLHLRAAEGRPAVRSAGQPGSHHRRRAGRLVLIGQALGLFLRLGQFALPLPERFLGAAAAPIPGD